MHNVGVFNHGICFEASSEMVYGIHLAADMLTTGGCSDAHFVINSWPEVFVTNSRFGINGIGDYAANAYVRITGTCDPVNAAGLGANTVYFTNNQFNQGQNLVGAFLEWKNIAPNTCPSNEIISEYVFTGNHIEGPKLWNSYRCNSDSDQSYQVHEQLLPPRSRVRIGILELWCSHSYNGFLIHW
jgi:hypothetical protein